MRENQFVLTSDECELLVAFHVSSRLEDLAASVGRDMSNVSRSLSRMAAKLPVIEKKGRSWSITPQGLELVGHIKESIFFQRSLFQKQSVLKIGTNREFASRVLGARFLEFSRLFPNTLLRISAFEEGVEQALLDGRIDIGIDCERPFNPEIKYRTFLSEALVVVCSPGFKKKHLKEISVQSLFSLPYLQCDRLFPDRVFGQPENQMLVAASFNDISTTRSVCATGLGWALLPKYAVADEVEKKILVEIPIKENRSLLTYGVWWPRSRKHLDEKSEKIQAWLKTAKI
jgi:DNA-binding transcriptional LysR family regulator